MKYYDSVIFFSKGSKLLGALFGDMKVFPRRIFENLDSLSRLPLIVEEFDFKFLIEIILTLSFFSLTTLYRMARNSNLANFGTINLHHFRRCFLSKRSSLEHPFEPLRKHDARYDVYAVIALKGHSRSLEYSSAFARVGRRYSSFRCSRLQSKNYFARDWK